MFEDVVKSDHQVYTMIGLDVGINRRTSDSLKQVKTHHDSVAVESSRVHSLDQFLDVSRCVHEDDFAYSLVHEAVHSRVRVLDDVFLTSECSHCIP